MKFKHLPQQRGRNVLQGPQTREPWKGLGLGIKRAGGPHATLSLSHYPGAGGSKGLSKAPSITSLLPGAPAVSGLNCPQCMMWGDPSPPPRAPGLMLNTFLHLCSRVCTWGRPGGWSQKTRMRKQIPTAGDGEKGRALGLCSQRLPDGAGGATFHRVMSTLNWREGGTGCEREGGRAERQGPSDRGTDRVGAAGAAPPPPAPLRRGSPWGSPSSP